MNDKVKKKHTISIIKSLTFLITLLMGASSAYLIYNVLLLSGIEDLIRYIVIGVIGILTIFFFILSLKLIKKKRSLLLFDIFAIIITIVFALGSYYINKAYSSISNMNKDKATYGTSLIVMSNSKIDSVSDLKKKKIGIIKDKSSIEGYVISQEIIKEKSINKDNLVDYDDFMSMLNDLYEGNVDAIFVSSGYISMFSSIDHFSNIKTETKVIVSKTKTMNKIQNTSSKSDSKITKPFTVLVLGIDSTEDNIKNATSFNGDSIILVTFNPKTLNATMLSIPRDTFVPIMCFKNHIQNKITHAAWYGESCMMSTIENFTGVDIDYYVKINFKGVVKLVDALGGVEVDVPYSFCEQNSNRDWGKNIVYVTKGLQTLNGEKALAFARNRHPNPSMCSKKWTNYYSDDFVRGQNQQIVIKALVNKLKTIRDVNKLYQILDLISKSMDTNFTTNQILSFYNIGKSILAQSKTDGEILDFDKLYLKTYGEYIYDEGMRMELSDQIYYKGSLEDVVNAMKVNLGLKDPKITKEFSFSINDVYEEKVIGKDNYSESSIALVPSFTGYSKTTATSWGIKNNVTITFKTVESSSYKYVDGQIISQSVPKNSLVSIAKTKGITLTVIKKISTTSSDDKIDCKAEANKENSTCKVPDFKNSNISIVTSWQSKITTSSIYVEKIATVVTDDSSKNNIVYDQTEETAGKYIYDLDSKTIKVYYYKYEAPEENNTSDPATNNTGIE